MQKDLEEKNKNRETIRQEAANQLSQISRKALYLVVLSEIDPFLSKEKLTEQAKAALAPKAIEDIRGVFIQSVLEDVVDTYTKSIIHGTVSGQMTVENAYIVEKRNASKKFLYLAKISVAPLKKIDGLVGQGDNSLVQSAIIDLTEPGKISGPIAGLLSAEDSSKVFQGIEELQFAIADDNSASKKQQQIIVENTNKHIADLDREIVKLEADLASRTNRIKQATQQITGAPCRTDISSCMKVLLDNLKMRFSLLENQKIAVKESEIITQRTVLMPEGEPSRDIAVAIQSVIGQLNSTYGKIDQFLDVTESLLEETKGVTRDEASKSTSRMVDAIRHVDSVSVYINPQDDGSFKVLIAANFNIDDKIVTENKTEVNENPPPPTSAKTENIVPTMSPTQAPRKTVNEAPLSTEDALEQDMAKAQAYVKQHYRSATTG